MRRFSLLVAAAGAAAVFSSPLFADGGHVHTAAPIGEPGLASAKARTVEVEVGDDMRFRPAAIRVKRGETIRFVVRNRGRLPHEMVFGRIADLKAHAALMQKFPNMQHDEPNMVSVAPGQTGELRWHFSHAGTVEFACLQPGHFEAGMRGRVMTSH